MTTPLSDVQREALARHLLHRFRMSVREKDGPLMETVAKVFDVAELLGVGVPTGAAFQNDYWTTVGLFIFTAIGGSRNLGKKLRILGHEITHGVQFWRNVIDLLAGYASQRGRAELEAEAERGGIEVAWLVDGTIPTDIISLDICRHGYAVESKPEEHDDFADLARNLLEQHVTSVKSGVLSTDVGIACHQWMLANAKDSIIGKVV